MSDLPIYLDHHATTPLAPEVQAAMEPWWRDLFGNPASHHVYGQQAATGIEQAQQQIAELIGAEPEEIVFTSGATEANNMALKGVLAPLLRQAQSTNKAPHVITSQAEHRAILDPLKRLSRRGVEVTFLAVDSEGSVSVEQVAEAIRPETSLVSLMWANNEVGTLNPVIDISELCADRGVLFHTDAVQIVGKLPVDVLQTRIGMLSLSAHKLHGPKGVGVLYVSRKGRRIQLEPQIEGGGHQAGLRSGTLPTPLIVGLGAACRLAAERMSETRQHLQFLRDLLETELLSALPDLIVNGNRKRRLPDNLNISVPGVDGEALLASLTEVAVSSGSACTSANPEPSHVLKAMGQSEELRKASLRFGVGRYNTSDEIHSAARHVIEVIKRLRGEMS